ncbi:hypothetical protein BH11PLA2_BH11PLA2_37110 [soil metagenome]
MKFDSAIVRKCLKSFDFNTLFREHLGWDKHQATLDIPVDGNTVRLTAVAQKRGFVAYVCPSIPDRAVRLKIDHQVTKTAREHFVIYSDQPKGQQVWQWVRREPGKPLASRDHRFDAATSGDALIQRLDAIAVGLDEEEQITVVEVAGRARAAFDVDKVTKKFYDRFKAEHAAFLKFIKGIKDQADLEWYTSLMLNRLMFVYFIQKKGFLDGDANYLQNRMKAVRETKGKDKFQSFYRYFLVRLFHDGLGKPEADRKLDSELEKLLGKVPYLNGGFFEVHQLEERNAEIEIPDTAFQKLFAFFDEFSWHLDERPLRSGNEINPDVVGYIFEKYINQKQMGAYYTKEDITEYISKNTIIPYLFDAAQKKCPIAFKPESYLWQLLKNDPDRYIYAAVRQGVVDPAGKVIPLPKEIEAGVADVAKRGGWNKPAAEPFALPTETWREHVARRTRCLELREKLRKGEVHQINDLITLNLDIWQFARDAIVNSEGPELLRAFWQAIAGRVPEKSTDKFEPGITVLDPTCGSGAFLFAALRILETLYADCLERMERFIEDADSPKKFTDFRDVRAQIGNRNERYFILKSIIINNLFGVDIMEEAVEICKLRLFLKLVAQVEKVSQIEPLPDIDFNIRAGNTLVGYVSLDEIRNSQKGTFGFAEAEIQRVEEDALLVEKAFQQFRQQQTKHGGKVTAKDKQELRVRLKKLDAELDRYLAGEYGIDANKPKAFNAWKINHQPFHWFVEFYGIMHGGGFDVIVGNPPWKEYAAVKKEYTVRGYATESCGNLHVLCTERSLRIRQANGRFSFIVQLPLVSSSRMAAARRVLSESSSTLHVIPFDDRPGKLFEGLQHCRSVIFLSAGGAVDQRELLTTRYQRWHTESRSTLFSQLEFARTSGAVLFPGLFPKYATDKEASVFRKVKGISETTVSSITSNRETRSFVFYQEATGYWVKATLGLPYYSKDGDVGAPAHGRYVFCKDADSAACVSAILNSSLFYAYFIAYGDCFHLSDTLVESFPIMNAMADDTELAELGRELNKSLKSNAVRKTINTRDGSVITYAEFFAAASKDIIDKIDRRIATIYGLSESESEFIINFDIKYRMGQEDGDEDAE